MTLAEVVLTVVTSAVTTAAVTLLRARIPLRALLPVPRPRPVDPELMAGIMRSAARVATTGGQPPEPPPSAPRPPVE
jgi:hypothetical protein